MIFSLDYQFNQLMVILIGNDLFIPGQETESKLPESCIQGFQRLLITTNFNPIYV